MRPRRGGLSALISPLLAMCIGLAGCATASSEVTGHALVTRWSSTTGDPITALANRYLAAMTPDQKIGQLLMVQFLSNDYSGDSVDLVRDVQPGALVMYAFQMPTAAITRDMLTQAQSDVQVPMLVSADNEGGDIDNLRAIYGSRPSATAIGNANDAHMAYDEGTKMANDMLPLGLNADLAPDVDVQTYAGPDQIDRTFGTTPEQVTKLAQAYLSGLQDHGVAGTLKHFPGLGDARVDAHVGLPVINRTQSDIQRIDLAPYQSIIGGAHPPDMVMSTDVLMPALDPDLPAEISPKIIQGVLRDQMHYDGVVLTDALYMKGVTDPLIAKGIPEESAQYEAAVLALKAGCDMLLVGVSTVAAKFLVQTIKDAITSGRLTQAQIDASVRRILVMKIRRGILPFSPEPPMGAPLSH